MKNELHSVSYRGVRKVSESLGRNFSDICLHNVQLADWDQILEQCREKVHQIGDNDLVI